MSWINDNKFLAGLGGGTLLGVALLAFVGMKGSSRYEAAMEKFVAASEEVGAMEKLPLYPKTANKDGKTKALAEYGRSVEALQAAFEPYRTKQVADVTPQEFTTALLAANAQVRKAFEEAGTTVPEPFFLGFESYKTTLAPAKTTGVLKFELSAITNLMLALAKAKPTALKNLYRPPLPEEEGQTYTPSATAVARTFPLEITFTGSENSARAFLTSLSSAENQLVVIRSLRATNEKKDPPKAADAKFDKPAAEKPAAAGADGGAFGGGFVLPGGDAPAADAPAAEAKPAPKAVDTSRILAQVLGSEQIQVFLRLDILEFLPAKKLP
jgi:hypothetical protein